MDNLKKKIDESRNIKPNSLNSYMISIKKLWNNTDENEFKNLDFLMNIDNIKEYLTVHKLATRRNYISAVIVSLDAMCDTKYEHTLFKYREYLEELNEQYKKQYLNGEKSKSQSKNWVTMKELNKVMIKIKKEILERNIFYKNEINKKEFMLLQKWVIANLYLNPENPPTRLDYSPMEVISKDNYDELEEEEQSERNYIVVISRNRKFFSFNEYKTSHCYGNNEINVGKKLNSVLNIWFKFNKTDSLLLNSKFEPLSANGLGKMIRATFASTGKNISVNMLRHVFLSEKYPNVNKEKLSDSIKMGHSLKTQSDYSKV